MKNNGESQIPARYLKMPKNLLWIPDTGSNFPNESIDFVNFFFPLADIDMDYIYSSLKLFLSTSKVIKIFK